MLLVRHILQRHRVWIVTKGLITFKGGTGYDRDVEYNKRYQVFPIFVCGEKYDKRNEKSIESGKVIYIPN